MSCGTGPSGHGEPTSSASARRSGLSSRENSLISCTPSRGIWSHDESAPPVAALWQTCSNVVREHITSRQVTLFDRLGLSGRANTCMIRFTLGFLALSLIAIALPCAMLRTSLQDRRS